MDMLKPPPSLSFTGDIAENYKRFKQRYQLYVKASGADVKLNDEGQIALFLHTIGDEVTQIYNTFDLTSSTKFDDLIKKFDNYFIPQKNESMNRHIFFSRVMKEDECIDDYVTELRILSNDCNFESLRDSLIRDQIIRGIREKSLRERLLKEHGLDLNKCIQICKTFEITCIQMQKFEKENKIEVAEVKRNSKYEYNKNQSKGKSQTAQGRQSEVSIHNASKKNSSCYKCGYSHGYKCPAYNVQCRKCGRRGHFARVCKNKNKVQVINESLSSDVVISSIKVGTINKNDLFESLQVGSKIIDFKLDTGSDCNVLPLKIIKQLGCNTMIKSSNIKLHNYDGSQINSLGFIDLRCKLINNRQVNLRFQVVKANCTPILGWNTMEHLKLFERKYLRQIKCNKNMQCHDIINKYIQIFDTNKIGCIKGIEYDIKLKEGAQGKVEPCRGVPIALHKPLKIELDRMVQMGIIDKVTEPTDYVSNVVIVKKPDGKLKICMDPGNLNNCIKREHFKLPTFEEVSSKMTGASIFSKIDATAAFFQIKLSEASSKLCVFNTPFGRYYFKRLPYGISSAPEIFHRHFKELFENIQGCEVFIDDIVIYAKNKEEHDFILNKVLYTVKENGVILNLNKCQFGVKEINYLGHILSKDGIKPDPQKINAIICLDKPKNVKEVQTVLGMITYVAKFIPNLSQTCEPLRKLIKKDSEWVWGKQQELAFKTLKEILISAPVLQYFDPEKSCKLSVDASKDALGAVLLQNNLPVAYASKAMTETQKVYAQIEKEMLAIVFGCTRFHQYIYGKRVQVESDHRPLETIFKKSLCDVPLRLQRMRLHLQKYDIDVKYRPGKELLIADALSRNYIKSNDDIKEKEIEAQVGMIIESIPVKSCRLEEIKKETENDREFDLLKKYIIDGWPDNIEKVPNSLRDYCTFKEELFVYDDLIFKNNCVVIPMSMRQNMLEQLHYNHLGVEKCKARARSCIFWPHMNKEIENKVQNCNTCCRFKKRNSKEPMTIREMPHKPWSVLGSDVFYYKEKPFLIIVDHYSKYFEIISLNNLSAEVTIAAFKSVFARFGIPDILYSDNGTNFCNQKFREFTKNWNFTHRTSSPTFPQSNGLAERYVQTVKNLFKKADYEKKDKFLALLEYRNTPNVDMENKTPSELLMNRNVQGLLPQYSCPSNDNIKIQTKLYKNSFRQKKYFDKNTKKLPELNIGQKVILEGDKKPFTYAEIIKKDYRPNSYKVMCENGQMLDRNRKYLHNCKDQSKLIIKKERKIDVDCDSGQSKDCDDKEQTVIKDNNIALQVQTESDNNQSHYFTTRSGRIVKPPSYLNDHVY